MSILDVKRVHDFVIDQPTVEDSLPPAASLRVTTDAEVSRKRFSRFLVALRQKRVARRRRNVVTNYRVHEDYQARESHPLLAQELVLRAWGQVRL